MTLADGTTKITAISHHGTHVIRRREVFCYFARIFLPIRGSCSDINFVVVVSKTSFSEVEGRRVLAPLTKEANGLFRVSLNSDSGKIATVGKRINGLRTENGGANVGT